MAAFLAPVFFALLELTFMPLTLTPPDKDLSVSAADPASKVSGRGCCGFQSVRGSLLRH